MKEKPILFSAPMVRAILAGTKTQTRRVVKYAITGPNQPHGIFDWHNAKGEWLAAHGGAFDFEKTNAALLCPYGQPGDRLWVRETWRYTASTLEESRAITEDITSGIAVDWRATYIDRCMKELGFSREEAEMADDFETWRPSIHMPRWASRILLEVVSVRVERLNDISEADANAEGCNEPARDQDWTQCRRWYRALWDQINGTGSWEANPWVWVISFKRIDNA